MIRALALLALLAATPAWGQETMAAPPVTSPPSSIFGAPKNLTPRLKGRNLKDYEAGWCDAAAIMEQQSNALYKIQTGKDVPPVFPKANALEIGGLHPLSFDCDEIGPTP